MFIILFSQSIYYMKRLLICFAIFSFFQSYAQHPNDISSADDIIKALYDVISGPSTQDRNWDRFRNLFHKDAKMFTIAQHKDSGKVIRAITPEQYIERNGKRLQEVGFVEKELHRITEVHAAVTHIFSTYQSDYTVNGTAQQARGINSIQLFNDGQRYYILSVYWDGDAKAVMAQKYLGN